MKLTKLLASVLLAATAMPASALTIELRDTGGVGAGSQAFQGFSTAARFWETVITSDVTVKLNVGYGTLGAGILGSTGSTTNVAYVGDVLPRLYGTGNSALDAIAAQNPPALRASQFIGGASIDALISAPKADGSGVGTPLLRVLDANDTGNNAAFSANTSLLKALGITPTYAGANAAIMADGSVTFSNQFNFDFDPTNGISADAIDFIGVAIHEIGHALGFRSGVDTFDGNANFTGNLQNFALMSIWDIFRYSAASTALGVNDWAIGGSLAAGTAPYFSIDGGETVFMGSNGPAYMSTGRGLGDGRQASHWKDNLAGQPQLGLLDPTVAFGQQSVFDALDLAAYDAMGWNVAFDVLSNPDREYSTRLIGKTFGNVGVPEPATWAMMIGGFGLVGTSLRGKRRTLATA